MSGKPTVNVPPLSIVTPSGERIPAKYQNEHLALTQALGLAERELGQSGARREWVVAETEDESAVLARVAVLADGTIRVERVGA